MAVEAMEKMVKRKIEFMNLLHDSLDAGQKLEMYVHTVHKGKEALRAVPFPTEPEVIASITTAIMNSPLPIEYKSEMAQSIHTKHTCNTSTRNTSTSSSDRGVGVTPVKP